VPHSINQEKCKPHILSLYLLRSFAVLGNLKLLGDLPARMSSASSNNVVCGESAVLIRQAHETPKF
jgi:hypothetical protein